ncbi:uncharacterized protein PRCAT00005530001 [Priceomyces carsonii]|uniref:uncharacterized protein n=1 Tax=Priceomyces carsonii TaxID=28549 RepID=UPI002ED8220A|nr:unnamed protein product [Priceomyces carsonii]
MGKGKSRGRRLEKKVADEVDTDSNDKNEIAEPSEDNLITKTTFFGLVDSNELDYFKQAEQTLNINTFESDEERETFTRSILEEAKGKELKLVTNQICSKLMERLILLANSAQLKRIFRLFSKHFFELCHHKYSSHVLETLFVRSAALIEKELTGIDGDIQVGDEEDDEEADVTMESLFNAMIDELKPHIKIMITDPYSSHVLRLLILVLSGKELPSTTTSNSVLRSKKSKIARKMIEIKDNDDFNRSFQTPASFKDQLKDICSISIQGQDTKHIRELAIHKVGSPVLQLLVQVEGIVDKERKIWFLLFDSNGKEPQEEAFMEYLLSDSVGSHFLESFVKNTGVRLMFIERLYELYMKDRILKLARRHNTGVYIVQALLLKLKPREVEFILDQLIPELANLISITEIQNLDLAKAVLDASERRSHYRREDIVDQLMKKFAPEYYEDKQSDSSLAENVLMLESSTLGNTRDDWPTVEERRRTLFLSKLVDYDSCFLFCLWNSFLNLPSGRFIQMCYHGVFSHAVEESLKFVPSESKETLILRKRVLNLFQNQIANLSCNSYGSHIVDKLWTFTIALPMYKDRFATELLNESHKVKESKYGKLVWKNWSMELFTRKRSDWRQVIKQQQEEYFEDQKPEKPIDLKIEQLAKRQNPIDASKRSNHGYPYDTNGKRRRIENKHL